MIWAPKSGLFYFRKGKMEKKYDFHEREEFWRNFWEQEGIYRFDENSSKPIYSVDTPPPYVSAEHLHAGHIMSYSQAEFIVRYKRMRGFNVYYPMGFDDNGLPTERYVEKKYNIDKSKISRKEFIEKCLEETKIGAKNYQNLWRSLGISVDWTKTYSTINEHCQKLSQWSFLDLYKKGKIYRKEAPVLWCTHCQTAISQADLEAEERKSRFYYIKAKVDGGGDLIFATTRPEMLPACMGMSVNPSDKRYKDLIGKKAILPLTKQKVYIYADENVDPRMGTGVVYYCSFGGHDDIEWLAEHPDVKPIHMLDTNGKFNERAGKYAGLKICDARDKIVEDLKKEGALEKIEDRENVTFTHERCGTDVEYIMTENWFIDVLSAKAELLKKGNELKWYPTNMKQIYESWVNGLKWDWCISRQRYYGVPFPVWYCKKCGEVVLPEENELPVDPTSDKPMKACSKCKNTEFEAENDVMDTWMTSSLTPKIGATLVQDKEIQEKLYPSSLRPQAFEIIRTWLFYTVVKSLYHDNSVPFTDVMISGHGLDEHGIKISKRLKNYVNPHDIVTKYGADALRYWATGATLGGNMRWNEEEVKKGKKTVIKLWNASRFVIGFLENENIEDPAENELEDADKWIHDQLMSTVETCSKHFDNYEYSKARNEIDGFFWNDFCDYYLEFIKYRVYGDNKASKNAALCTVSNVLSSILKLYAPILPFVTEEIYQAYFKNIDKVKSIHLTDWPGNQDLYGKSKEFELILKLVDQIRAYKTKQGISIGKEIPEYKTKEKLTDSQREFLEKTQRVEKVITV